MSTSRISQVGVVNLREQLSERDRALLVRVADLKLVSGAQLEILHFGLDEHANTAAAGRACRRSLQRLVQAGLLTRLERQIGGVRGGSAGFIYALAATGQRVLELDGPRRRFREPSTTFVRHTLAIGQLVVDLTLRTRQDPDIELLHLQPEPRCWRRYQSIGGQQVVRPDLFVGLGVGDYEHRWFVEIDLGTETLPRRIEKCKQYEAYYRSGVEQTAHEVFPRVLWSMPRPSEAQRLQRAIAASGRITTELFVVTTADKTLDVLKGGAL